MARPKEFDVDRALDAALEVFREHGFDGASSGMLADAMKIGRQSIYDTFGDKWQLYLSALRRYVDTEITAHAKALRSETRALDGIKAALRRVVQEAHQGCLGINSVCEFGSRQPEVNDINAAADHSLRQVFVACVREAQLAGDLLSELDPNSVVDFLVACITGIRVAARGGAQRAQLEVMERLAIRALR
ncbi:HTH-type transcriptional repressor ComR [Ralstonia edaphis]|uniref:HTH-type transcriptional repressor ComR n=1 Tax=Ralstonia edaphi TaxID=3058599 RepID=A0AB72X793_9RALS|nr:MULTISPECIES: TetR/AcrR family transcriptional regulator [unclassified Ralstonia]TXD63194.1 TetR/AcrR family transcriptional regulator [Ralstonia sp. TCR112]CAJ0742158.1 HTH-type transcriptional repressor ComR [Ralstonia sp. LMG 6871]